MPNRTYQQDVAFLRKHTQVIELSGPENARVALTPAYQGRVMTSTIGKTKASFGWINGEFVESGREDALFNNYGGEDRFWLGPEAGQFGLWFSKGDSFDLKHWKTPQGINTGEFAVLSQSKQAVRMSKQLKVNNAAGTAFCCGVQRVIRVLSAQQAAEHLGSTVPRNVSMVGFESVNTLTNTGKNSWSRKGGLLSIWSLGMFKAAPRAKAIVPFISGDEKMLGVKPKLDYFGPLPAKRGRILKEHVLFSVDGNFRSKIGIPRPRAKNVLGSFDPDARVLTIIQFNLPCGAANLDYVNSLWEHQKSPFAGDVVNSYNDGPADPRRPGLGTCYELETSSPAANLAKGQSITHTHRTFHFSGNFEELCELSIKALGFDICTIR